ncbi:MAG: right-handed parallel beta-helix repeat-containing protein [Acidobacteriota bacterium]
MQRLIFFLFLLFHAFVFFSFPLQAQITPVVSIQQRIDSAKDGDTVLVERGVYTGNYSFNGKKIILASRFIFSRDTADVSHTVLKAPGLNDNVVKFTNHEDSNSVIIGFAIKGGKAGIFCDKSSPKILNCFLEDNGLSGLALMDANPSLKELLIKNNKSGYGGGIFCLRSSLVIENTTIFHNVSVYEGGGIYSDSSVIILKNCTLDNNLASGSDGGGIYSINESKITIEKSKLINNISGWYGGGIYLKHSSLTMNNAALTGNLSASNYGGGLFIDYSEARLTNVLIKKNRVRSHVGPNSGGGGIYNNNNSKLFLSNVTIAQNRSDGVAGGLLNENNSSVVFDTKNRCNIYLNEAHNINDIYSESGLTVAVDTFTVLHPKMDQVYRLDSVKMDILHGKFTEDITELYVASDGDNSNSGRSFSEPLKSLNFAKTLLQPSESRHATIYLAPGTYSYKTTGDVFPIYLKSHLSIKGSGVGKTIMVGYWMESESCFYFYDALDASVEDLTIKDNGYKASTPVWGGAGFYLTGSSVTLKNIEVSNCYSYYGGAIFAGWNSNVTLINALLANNSGERYGGTLYGFESTFNLFNVTIANNSTDSSFGGAIYSEGSTFNIFNSILWNNGSKPIYQNRPGNTVYAGYSDIQYGKECILSTVKDTLEWLPHNSIVWLQNNLDTDPMFADPASGNYRLKDSSACIGAGTDSIKVEGKWHMAALSDIEYHSRPNPAKSRPDMGAFENALGIPADVISEGNTKPGSYALNQNYPNPFNPVTTISYSVPKESFVELKVFDMLGREVALLVNKEQRAGNYTVHFDGSFLTSGIYIYTIRSGNFTDSKKLMILK